VDLLVKTLKRMNLKRGSRKGGRKKKTHFFLALKKRGASLSSLFYFPTPLRRGASRQSLSTQQVRGAKNRVLASEREGER